MEYDAIDIDVIPLIKSRALYGMRGDRRRSIIIFIPLCSNARSTASNMGYSLAIFNTQSRNKYLPNKNAMIEPKLAPKNTVVDAIITALVKLVSYTYPKVKPHPIVKIAPGMNRTVQRAYTKINTKTPA
mmetsp:Transcript_35501/g.52002  ORF Transcript_35501/g.52002 Transcript_35501/m.52002 type:complete len:129 (-) Transcript_35501:101-487(-)